MNCMFMSFNEPQNHHTLILLNIYGNSCWRQSFTLGKFPKESQRTFRRNVTQSCSEWRVMRLKISMRRKCQVVFDAQDDHTLMVLMVHHVGQGKIKIKMK